MSIRAQLHRAWWRCAFVTFVAAAAASGLAVPAIATAPTHHSRDAAARSSDVIPKPVSQAAGHGRYTLTPHARIVAGPGATAVANQLADDLRPATGYSLPVVTASGRHEARHGRDISLQLDRSAAVPGDRFGEGYRLQVSPHGVVARAATAHGLFNAVQTIRQMLPASIASRTRRHGPWTMRPRRSWTIRATSTAASCSTSPGTTSRRRQPSG